MTERERKRARKFGIDLTELFASERVGKADAFQPGVKWCPQCDGYFDSMMWPFHKEHAGEPFDGPMFTPRRFID